MSKSNEYYFSNAIDLIENLRNKSMSSVELVQASISRIEKVDEHINAVVVRDFEKALDLAKAADELINKGKHLPLLGLPITVKESFNVAGLPTTWGDPQFKDWIPDEDALTVTRLKNAGAIVLGKTNVPFMLRDWQAYNDIYGTTNNPWDYDKTPGGSSGGAAAALASGYVSLELGSDMAGSLRTPASFCGVCAHKPSQDLIPLRGAAPPATTPIPFGIEFVTAGPMARTVQDLQLEFNIIAGPDDRLNGKGYKLALPQPRHQKLSEYRISTLDSHPLCPTVSAIGKVINELVDDLTKLDVQISHNNKALPDVAEATRIYCKMMAALSGVHLPTERYEALKAEASQVAVDDTSMAASRMRGFTSSYRDWCLAIREREKLRSQWTEFFKDNDILICPVMPTVAFPHNHTDPISRVIEIDGKSVSYYDQFTWISIATLFGLPSTVIPIAFTEDGLPIGLQIIGDYLEDQTTLHVAKLIEQALGGFKSPSFSENSGV